MVKRDRKVITQSRVIGKNRPALKATQVNEPHSPERSTVVTELDDIGDLVLHQNTSYRQTVGERLCDRHQIGMAVFWKVGVGPKATRP